MSQMRHVLSPTPHSRKARSEVQYSELFFRECGIPRLRNAHYPRLRTVAVRIFLRIFFRFRNNAISDAEYEIAHCVRIV